MYINEESLRITGVSSIDYINWCKITNRKPSKTDSKKEFFRLIKKGKIYRDKETGHVIYEGDVLDDNDND